MIRQRYHQTKYQLVNTHPDTAGNVSYFVRESKSDMVIGQKQN